VVDLEREIERLRTELRVRDEQLRVRDEVIMVQAAKITDLQARLEKLAQLVGEQGRKLGQHSGNSNLPPSSDGPGQGASSSQRKKKGGKRGGRKGHRGSHRRLVAPDEVDRVVDMFPARCDACHQWLPKVLSLFPKRHQYTELEPLVPKVTEYRRHEVCCPSCGHRTQAAYDDDVIPRTAFGPRLMAVVVLLTGVYHLSRRRAARLLYDLLGLRISLGSISNIERRMSAAVEPAVEEALEVVLDARVKHADGTSWLERGVLLALWTVATAAATVFAVLPDNRGKTLRHKLLRRSKGVLVSDRASALKFWVMRLRQICWAHLLRKFVGFSERDGPTGTLGRELLDCTVVVFTYWSELKEGRLTRAQLQARIEPVRADFERTLRRAIDSELPGLSGSCADIWEHAEALWTFVDTPGVEPTNNHAEQELRGFVLWRKRSFGAQSEHGHRFAERLMTVAHTARKQGRDILAFLVACAERDAGGPAPSLFAAA